ncbi:unnamed protein product [Schistosoma margrebowiei]|uniref:Uncharacterized protein n=1 Tax=Schistosoma margrebowiei TaxID=48269 RepID=A0A183MUX6_9TREM|nr:unnamed protein product [Schistosoma margrebowiei]
MLLYSGHEEENIPNTQGVALILYKEAQNAHVGWESHGSRIIKASFKIKKEGITMSVFQCYALTNGSNEDDKDHVYEMMKPVIANCQRKDLTILMGDLNAQIGIDNTEYEDIMGQYRLGKRNANGAFHKMVIGSTIFPHRHSQSYMGLTVPHHGPPDRSSLCQ